MKAKVYVETTVISYLTSRPSRDLVVAGHQQVTQDWWQTAPARFDLVASRLVAREAGAGDIALARQRLAALAPLELLELSEESTALAQEFIDTGAVPQQAVEDALHIAIAVTNGADYLVTWNCRHIANATRRAQIEQACRAKGYVPVAICTPEELLED